jgi:prepilin-type N-terminal cleavage/methylation domain-containing protein
MKHLTGKSGGRRGFTLVELLVVIVIIGILASLVVGLSGTAGR